MSIYGTNHSMLARKNVRFMGIGNVSISTGGSINPTYPAGLIPGDIAFLQSYHRYYQHLVDLTYYIMM
jgi:hypothetical protein